MCRHVGSLFLGSINEEPRLARLKLAERQRAAAMAGWLALDPEAPGSAWEAAYCTWLLADELVAVLRMVADLEDDRVKA